MFDVSRIKDALGSLFSGSVQQTLNAAGLADMLAQAGVDPTMLAGLDQQEIMSLLQQYGIDPNLIDPGQLGELIQSSGVGGPIADAAADWLRSRGG